VQPETPAAESEQVPRLPPGPVPAPIVNPTTEPRTDELRLHVAAAAHRVGVAPSTLRTWDRRYGIGPTGHTPGQHRRYSPDDLARLDLMHRALILGATPADAAAHALTALPPLPDAGGGLSESERDVIVRRQDRPLRVVGPRAPVS
jgi:transposase-like protein